jgi:hypothetical protein
VNVGDPPGPNQSGSCFPLLPTGSERWQQSGKKSLGIFECPEWQRDTYCPDPPACSISRQHFLKVKLGDLCLPDQTSPRPVWSDDKTVSRRVRRHEEVRDHPQPKSFDLHREDGKAMVNGRALGSTYECGYAEHGGACRRIQSKRAPFGRTCDWISPIGLRQRTCCRRRAFLNSAPPVRKQCEEIDEWDRLARLIRLGVVMGRHDIVASESEERLVAPDERSVGGSPDFCGFWWRSPA